MTAQEYFRMKGRGSQKIAAIDSGFSLGHFNSVISGHAQASQFFANCLKTAHPEIDCSTLWISDGRKPFDGIYKKRIYFTKNIYEVWCGPKYLKGFKTMTDAENYINRTVFATYEKTLSGIFAEAKTERGEFIATIHQISRSKGWRICYASCRGVLARLTGKSDDKSTLRDIKNLVDAYMLELESVRAAAEIGRGM